MRDPYMSEVSFDSWEREININLWGVGNFVVPATREDIFAMNRDFNKEKGKFEYSELGQDNTWHTIYIDAESCEPEPCDILQFAIKNKDKWIKIYEDEL